MKQYYIFGDVIDTEDDGNYTKKIDAPIYKPKGTKPHPLELANLSKYQRLKHKIKKSDIPDDVKKFIIIGASRHIVFDYAKIADFYAHSDAEVQDLMEQSALVIIDFEKAIQRGYTNLSEGVVQEYLKQKK